MPRPDRRQFFRESLRSLIRPVARILETRLRPLDAVLPVLRPPGAIGEDAFLDTCYRCGNCVEACPADAIRLLPAVDERLNNTPVIDPDLAACVICDDLACMKSCPSGALRLVASPADIRMGTAEVDAHCLRDHDEDCRICVQQCPLGSAAIDLEDQGRVRVHADGCVGCGVCQFACPTQPRAIVVIPSAR